MNANDASDAPADKATSAAPADFGTLARKIRSRTTDLLAVAIVLVGGLSLGTKLVRWWGEEGVPPAQQVAESHGSWGADGSPVSLEFGESPIQLQRQTFQGGREAVFARLTDTCAAAADEAHAVSAELHPAEGRLLEQLDKVAPVRERAGVWGVYRIELPVTLIVAVRTFRAEETGDRAVRRVVCWGMAQPAGEGSWVTYTMRPARARAAGGPAFADIPIPVESRKILSLREEAGGALLAFEGTGTPREWTAHFSRRLGERGWKPAQPWSESPSGWSAAFVPEDGSVGRIEVSISRVGERGLSGIVSVSAQSVYREAG